MRTIPSALEGKQMKMHRLAQMMEKKGFALGGSWDYDHGFFDYRLPGEETYYFVRIPITSAGAPLDEPEATVVIGQPFVLGHQYQRSIDYKASSSNITASVNQFQSPEDPDTDVPDEMYELGAQLVQEMEADFVS
ncbi:hypothetical protein G4V62_04705 [Bacillaceae bacterium SIJ1]|uniref:YugN family protein n=1 Tax=Litoribacterium kuwaitense TaxID=1398745 RepID=UPI0013EA2A2E|nr:YugN family protein [Litoribacterium kuwaitense]NGP44286.1 hypothetical protein [Litoribacterium kuwaitense]